MLEVWEEKEEDTFLSCPWDSNTTWAIENNKSTFRFLAFYDFFSLKAPKGINELMDGS